MAWIQNNTTTKLTEVTMSNKTKALLVSAYKDILAKAWRIENREQLREQRETELMEKDETMSNNKQQTHTCVFEKSTTSNSNEAKCKHCNNVRYLIDVKLVKTKHTEVTMSNNKQSSVEWFWNQIPEILPFTVDTITGMTLHRAYQQAKEMEVAGKEMSYSDGYAEGYKRALELIEWYIKQMKAKEKK